MSSGSRETSLLVLLPAPSLSSSGLDLGLLQTCGFSSLSYFIITLSIPKSSSFPQKLWLCLRFGSWEFVKGVSYWSIGTHQRSQESSLDIEFTQTSSLQIQSQYTSLFSHQITLSFLSWNPFLSLLLLSAPNPPPQPYDPRYKSHHRTRSAVPRIPRLEAAMEISPPPCPLPLHLDLSLLP